MRRLPAEWELQDAVLLTWPHAGTDWRRWLSEVESVYVRLVREISRREKVILVCADNQLRLHVRELLQSADAELENVTEFICPSNDTWTRDYGPLTVLDGDQRRLVDFTFNGWGNKYPALLDDAVNRCLHAAGAFADVDLERVERVLEGGAIDADGQGTVLATRHSLQRRLREGESLEQMVSTLEGTLGIRRILWLTHGCLQGDDTDGHVDTLARFCAQDTLAFVACSDPGDPQFRELEAMADELGTLRTAEGQAYRLVPLPTPRPRFGQQGQRLPATYANFLVINGAVLVPQYDDPADPIALERLEGCFPGRDAIGVPCLPLLQQYGSLHCVTMHLPANTPTPCPEASASV